MLESEKFFKALNDNRVSIYTTGSIDDEWQNGMKTGSVDRREYEIYVQPEPTPDIPAHVRLKSQEVTDLFMLSEQAFYQKYKYDKTVHPQYNEFVKYQERVEYDRVRNEALNGG